MDGDDLDVVVRFLNTIDVEGGADDLADGDAAARWLADHGLLGEGVEVGAVDLATVHRVRSGLRELATVHHEQAPDVEAARGFGEAARGLPLRAVADPEGRVRLEPAGEGVAAALARLLAAVAHADAVGSWRRVKLCAADTCRYAFVDESRNRSRRWCAMGVCGNRQKTRAYRQRQATGGAR